MPHRPLGGITTFGPLWYEGSQTFCSLQNECYFFMMLEGVGKKVCFAFTHCASHFQILFCSYRNMDPFITWLFVNALTGTKGWEEKQKGTEKGGDGRRMEKRRGEEKKGEENSTEEERGEDCFSTMRTVRSEKFEELATSWCWHLVPYC